MYWDCIKISVFQKQSMQRAKGLIHLDTSDGENCKLRSANFTFVTKLFYVNSPPRNYRCDVFNLVVNVHQPLFLIGSAAAQSHVTSDLWQLQICNPQASGTALEGCQIAPQIFWCLVKHFTHSWRMLGLVHRVSRGACWLFQGIVCICYWL